MIRCIQFPQLTTSGTVVGSAVGTVTTREVVMGRVLGVYLDYSGTAATTDVTISTPHSPSVTVITVSNSVTDGWYYPRVQVHSTAGAALTYDGTRTVCEPVPVNDHLQLAVAQGGTAATVDAWVVVEV